MAALESTLSNRVSRTQHEKSLPITCLVWNPQMNGELAYADDQVSAALIIISRIILVYYCKCCNLIGSLLAIYSSIDSE